MSVLEFKNVSKSFPGVKALSGISFSVEKGDVHVLIGENGAGKSTLIKILTGVNKPDEGSEIWIDDKKVDITSPVDALNQGIEMCIRDRAFGGHILRRGSLCGGTNRQAS